MALHRRSPRTLSMALSPLRDALAPPTVLAGVQAAWRDVVGELIAREAAPVSERAGTLTVNCSASVWAQELELMSEDIITRLNAQLPEGRLKDLRCVVSGR
jgi:predicted nucleic acid-binding Zn ribbon protein